MKNQISEEQLRKIIRKELIKEQVETDSLGSDSFWTGVPNEGDGSTLVGLGLGAAIAGGLIFIVTKKKTGYGPLTLADNFAANFGIGKPIYRLMAPVRAVASGLSGGRPRMSWRDLARHIVNVSSSSGPNVAGPMLAQRAKELLIQWGQNGSVKITKQVAQSPGIEIVVSQSPTWTIGARGPLAAPRPSLTKTLDRYVSPGRRSQGGQPGTWYDDVVPDSFWDDMGAGTGPGAVTPRVQQGIGRGIAVRVGTAATVAALGAEMIEGLSNVRPWRQLMQTALMATTGEVWNEMLLQRAILQDPDSFVGFVDGLNTSQLLGDMTGNNFSTGGLMTEADITSLRPQWEAAIVKIADTGWFTDLASISMEEFEDVGGGPTAGMDAAIARISGLPSGYTVYDLAKLSQGISEEIRISAFSALNDFWITQTRRPEAGELPSTRINNFFAGCHSDYVVKIVNGPNAGQFLIGASDSVPESAGVAVGEGLQGAGVKSTSLMASLGTEDAWNTIVGQAALEGAVIDPQGQCADQNPEDAINCVYNIVFGEELDSIIYSDDDPQTIGRDESEAIYTGRAGADTPHEQQGREIEAAGQQLTDCRSELGSTVVDQIAGLYDLFASLTIQGECPNGILNQIGSEWLASHFDSWYAKIDRKAKFKVFKHYMENKENDPVTNMKEYMKERLVTGRDTWAGYPLQGTLLTPLSRIENPRNWTAFIIGVILMDDDDVQVPRWPLRPLGNSIDWQDFYRVASVNAGVGPNQSAGQYVAQLFRMGAGLSSDYYGNILTWLEENWE